MPSTTDPEPCLALLDSHQGILHRVARTYCPRVEDRDDLLQEMALQVWQSYPRFDGRCKFSTWMYRIALNVAISFHRRESAHHHLLSGDEHWQIIAAPAEAGPPSEDMQTLQRFIEGLDRLNKALALLYLEGHSHQEIAEILGISASNAATKIDRLKQRLRRGLPPGPSACRSDHGTR